MLTIYKITNKTNGFVYVGQTSCGINIRWARHIISAFKKKRQMRCRGVYVSKFHRVIKHYGINNFKVEVIKRVEDYVGRKIEDKYIHKFVVLGKSYNMQHSPMHGMHHGDVAKINIGNGLKKSPYNILRRKLRAIALRRRIFVRSKLTRLQMSKVKRGINNPMYGCRKVNGKWVVPC